MMKKLRIKLIKSLIAAKPKNKITALTLGLRKINKEVIVPDNKAMRGMIQKISYLLDVKEE